MWALLQRKLTAILGQLISPSTFWKLLFKCVKQDSDRIWPNFSSRVLDDNDQSRALQGKNTVKPTQTHTCMMNVFQGNIRMTPQHLVQGCSFFRGSVFNPSFSIILETYYEHIIGSYYACSWASKYKQHPSSVM